MDVTKSALDKRAVSAPINTEVQAKQHPAPDWLAAPDAFVHRHVGPRPEDWAPMLDRCGYKTLAEMMDAVVPPSIRRTQSLQLPPAIPEWEGLRELRQIAAQNQVYRSFLGQGYYDCFTPPVLLRNVLENPGWYTQYTPYQAEIAQGRLELLLHFQTMICDLTGLAIANASLLDEGTAAAEAMTLCFGLKEAENRRIFFVSNQCHPQTIEVVKSRAWPLGLEVLVGDHRTFEFSAGVFGALVQYPATDGCLFDYEPLVRKAHDAGALVVVAADLLSLVLLRTPGEFGADVAVGSTQRFGVPMGFGGPHAAYFATRDEFKRRLPGRLVGVSKDAQGRPAFRLALQTREQHIRREKATSNICTAQVLLAIMAALYAMYHGPHGLRRIARRVLGLTRTLADGLQRLGCQIGAEPSFDTLRVTVNGQSAADVRNRAVAHQINLRIIDAHTVGLALDETTTEAEVAVLWRIFNHDQAPAFTVADIAWGISLEVPAPYARTSSVLSQWPFNRYHSETEMLRYLRRLESRDLSLTTSMIPLGSCTMKLNAAVEMMPISWPEFNRLHPFAPADQTRGYQILFSQLEQWLAEITGFAGVSLQPNAGSQGEYTGLLVIRKYHESRKQQHREVCLIPASAHGTNPASATLAGLKVVAVACDRDGNVDLGDLRAKAEAHRHDLAALMVTYPSTHGVFESGIKEICQIVHEHGGQVYLDGANMNAQVGLCRPGDFGADVCHLNLHKTFSIPHGGGGPGVGPICVAPHLAPFLPGHSVVAQPGRETLTAVASAPWGSASILPIAWTYIRLMGPGGLVRATQAAILNANYVAKRMQACFPVLYRGHANLVAHECILDLRAFKNTTVEDVAKRLMDFGFHAPTISWPVAGTMMVEPTESESKAELDRFCDALTAIHAEMLAVESGQMDRQNNPLKNAPHTADLLAAERWDRPYSREQAVFPAPWLREHKFWPAVSRIDNVYGDRNPLCTCLGIEALDLR
jgi:glycine dehydrogenase